MTSVFKAKIVVGSNSIELEGSEEFISKYLDSFRGIIETTETSREPAKKVIKKVSNKNNKARESNTSDKKTKKKVKRIDIEEFDLHKDPTLENFLKEKLPSGDSARIRIPIIAYYIQFVSKLPHFTEGNIEYAYRTLGLKPRPTFLRQTITNLKNEKSFFQENEDNAGWTLTRPGEIYVDEKLPSKDDK